MMHDFTFYIYKHNFNPVESNQRTISKPKYTDKPCQCCTWLEETLFSSSWDFSALEKVIKLGTTEIEQDT